MEKYNLNFCEKLIHLLSRTQIFLSILCILFPPEALKKSHEKSECHLLKPAETLYICLVMLLPNPLRSFLTLSGLSSLSSLPNVPTPSCFSPSLGLLGHGPTQSFGVFGELHEDGLDRGEVSGDLDHAPLDGRGDGPQVLLGVGVSASQPDAQLSGGEDGQGEGVPLGQKLMFPHASFQSTHSEDPRGTGLDQRTGPPLPGQGLPTRLVLHSHCLSVLRSGFQADAVPVGAVTLPLSLVLLSYAADQLSSHHHAVTLFQDGAERHLCLFCLISSECLLKLFGQSGLISWLWFGCFQGELLMMLQLA